MIVSDLFARLIPGLFCSLADQREHEQAHAAIAHHSFTNASTNCVQVVLLKFSHIAAIATDFTNRFCQLPDFIVDLFYDQH